MVCHILFLTVIFILGELYTIQIHTPRYC